MHTPEPAAHAAQLLSRGEYFEAFRYLNGLTAHRFTAIYRREGEQAWNVVLYDKANPYAPQLPEVAAEETYCSLAMAECRVVMIDDALTDQRLHGHAARSVIRSYCGAALMDEAGLPFGTLCHFDFEPVECSLETAGLLEQISFLLHPAGVSAALQSDLARRLDNLDRTLPLLAASLDLTTSADQAFREMAEPIAAPMYRLAPDATALIQSRLDELKGAFYRMSQERFDDLNAASPAEVSRRFRWREAGPDALRSEGAALQRLQRPT